jgi:hypothetical protein
MYQYISQVIYVQIDTLLGVIRTDFNDNNSDSYFNEAVLLCREKKGDETQHQHYEPVSITITPYPSGQTGL